MYSLYDILIRRIIEGSDYMSIVRPACYDRFHCTASLCRHTCCRGWEIDIDPETLKRYKALADDHGLRILDHIRMEDDTAFFTLTEDESCPFLRKDGLCEMITRLGEDSLCDICRLHPRFVNVLSDRQEIGLGLCCEEACRLILTGEEKAALIVEGEETLKDEDTQLLDFRQNAIDIMQDRGLTVEERLYKIETLAGPAMPRMDGAQLKALFMPLERMEADWTARLNGLDDAATAAVQDRPQYRIPLEQLAVYLLYRQLPQCVSEDIRLMIAVITLSVRLVSLLSDGSMEMLLDNARLFSAEIEYSDTNIGLLMDEICQIC